MNYTVKITRSDGAECEMGLPEEQLVPVLHDLAELIKEAGSFDEAIKVITAVWLAGGK